MGPSVLGLGMGACSSSIFDVAVGDVAPDEAGSASGSLSAVQQLASAFGSAAVTTVFLARLHHSGVDALRTSLIVVAGIIMICVALVRLRPRTPRRRSSSAVNTAVASAAGPAAAPPPVS